MSADKGEAGQSLVSDEASRELLVALGQLTGGMSPQAFGGAWWNVLSRLAPLVFRNTQQAYNSSNSSFRQPGRNDFARATVFFHVSPYDSIKNIVGWQ